MELTQTVIFLPRYLQYNRSHMRVYNICDVLQHNILPSRIVLISELDVQPKYYDYNPVYLLFIWLPFDIIKFTLLNTTQYARMPMSSILKNYYKSTVLAMNVDCCGKYVATDAIYYETPDINEVRHYHLVDIAHSRDEFMIPINYA